MPEPDAMPAVQFVFLALLLIGKVYAADDRLAIVFLIAKQHNSYARPGSKDSLKRTGHALQLLYENMLGWTRADVLLFHNGDFDANDLKVHTVYSIRLTDSALMHEWVMGVPCRFICAEDAYHRTGINESTLYFNSGSYAYPIILPHLTYELPLHFS